MKSRLLVFVCFAVGLVTLASPGFAGDFHSGINLICSDCHVMHFSQQHGYTPVDGTFTPLGTGPNAFLLRNDVNDLCLACHDGQSWAPDVFQSHSNGYTRQAGALNVVGGTGLYPPNTGHTLGSTADAPGSNPAWSNPAGLECTDCHAAHGRAPSGFPTNGSYRNLFSPTSKGITYVSGAANDVNRWVYEDASSGVNASHYGNDHITFNEPTATQSQYADYCKSCHTDFHGDMGGVEVGGVPITGGYEEFKRHPASTVNIGALSGGHSSLSRFVGHTNQVQVLSPTGVRAGSYVAANTDLTVSCMSCHKGHGNQNAFGLIYMLGTGTITEQGDDGVDARNNCRQCHSMGGSSTAY